MSKRGWLILGVGCVVVAVALVVTLIVRANFSGPRDYIADHYTRASAMDQSGGGRAYTSSAAPAAVAAAIAAKTHPKHRRNTGDRYFLQYSNDIVAVTPYQRGSMILVDNYRTGYQRHHTFISTYGWPSTPRSGGIGNDYRGGGTGGGK